MRMGVLRHKAAALRWYRLVSPLYDPLVGETFWPRHLQRDVLSAVPLAGARVLDVGCGTRDSSGLRQPKPCRRSYASPTTKRSA